MLSGAQAVHTMCWDEALGLPTEEAVLLALRTQQILAHEIGMTRTADPLGGSYYVESLTDEIERRARAAMDEIDRSGGVTAGIEDGSLERAIADAAYRSSRRSSAASARSWGSTSTWTPRPRPRAWCRSTTCRGGRRRASSSASRASGPSATRACCRPRSTGLEDEARGEGNLMPAIVEAVEAYGSIGEICDRLATVFGRHAPSRVV